MLPHRDRCAQSAGCRKRFTPANGETWQAGFPQFPGTHAPTIRTGRQPVPGTAAARTGARYPSGRSRAASEPLRRNLRDPSRTRATCVLARGVRALEIRVVANIGLWSRSVALRRDRCHEGLTHIFAHTKCALSCDAEAVRAGQALEFSTFLVAGGAADRCALQAALQMTEHILEREIAWPTRRPIPEARTRPVDRLDRQMI